MYKKILMAFNGSREGRSALLESIASAPTAYVQSLPVNPRDAPRVECGARNAALQIRKCHGHVPRPRNVHRWPVAGRVRASTTRVVFIGSDVRAVLHEES